MNRDSRSGFLTIAASVALIAALAALPGFAQTIAPVQPAAAPLPAPPVLMLETAPPGAEVYVDEERVGKTSSEGKLKVSTLAPGEHRVRISAPGFDDLSRSVELTAGQTNTVAVALSPQKPAVTERPANPQPAGRGQVALPGSGQKSRKPMTKAQVIELLQNGVPSTRVDELVRAYGIAFELTTEVVVDLQDAGARDDLIRTLKEIAPKPEPVAPPAKAEPAPVQPAAAPPPAPPVLMLETTPAGAEVYVDEERAGKTGPEGKLKMTTLAPGEHRVRISAQGFDDLTRTVELTAGQTNTVAVALAPQKPAVKETPANPQAAGRTPGGAAGLPPGGNPMDAYKAILSGMNGGDEGDPNTKRFYVTHEHGKALRPLGYGGGMCYGWLIIGKEHVQYSSNNEDDAFDVPANEITELQIKSNHIRFRIKDKKYHLMTQDMGMLGGDAQGPGSLQKAFESVGLKSGKTP